VLLPSAESTLPLPIVNVMLSSTPVWLIRSPVLVPNVSDAPAAKRRRRSRVRLQDKSDTGSRQVHRAWAPPPPPLNVPELLVACKTPPLAVRLPPVIVPAANCKLPVSVSRLLAPVLFN